MGFQDSLQPRSQAAFSSVSSHLCFNCREVAVLSLRFFSGRKPGWKTQTELMTENDRQKRFEDLCARHWQAVFRYALRRTANEASAQDVVIETFAVCWRRLDEVRDPALLWLYGVARRLVAQHMRQERHQESLAFRIVATDIDLRTDVSPPDGSEPGELFRALSRLRKRDQELLLLVAWDGLTHEEAARVLGCSRGAFTKRFVKARSRLEELIG